ncbi:hypothetical protein HDZ31DRAFT_74500 [Schizophyllum fasciatum]
MRLLSLLPLRCRLLLFPVPRQTWDTRIQHISDFLRASSAYDRTADDMAATKQYRTLGSTPSDPRMPTHLAKLEQRVLELAGDREKSLNSVAEQLIWPIDPLAGPSEALEKQHAETLESIAAFSKAVIELYELVTDVFARHKKQQEEEELAAAAKAQEEEASRKRQRENEEASAGPEQELADKLAQLELDIREMKADFVDQESEIEEQVDLKVREILEALEGPEPIDVDTPSDDPDAPSPDERIEEQVLAIESLSKDVVDVAQTIACEDGAHDAVLRQRVEIAALRAEVEEFNAQAPSMHKELEQLAERQGALERELEALQAGFHAHVDRHPPTPPRSPTLQPASLLEVPGYLSLARADDDTPSPIEEAIAVQRVTFDSPIVLSLLAHE